MQETEGRAEVESIPRSKDDDYSREAVEARLDFVRRQTGARTDHLGAFAFDPSEAEGNVENLLGAAQVPLGLAGPLRVNGEHVQGDVFVPMATSEGTLVASYNRGMKLVRDAGGVTTTVIDDSMQRAPVFVFTSAREARAFRDWINESFDELRDRAEATTKAGRLIEIDPYTASRLVWVRFNYTTGDAAGQNMTGKATLAACEWILEQRPEIEHYYLEGNFATDKKASQVNIMRTRGKRVVAEAVVPNELLESQMRTTGKLVYRARQIATAGGFLSGVNNNGSHSANGITAMFIACGQDVANVAESSAALVYAELRENGDYYHSITLPSLIVGTYGGGTGLPTQRECLEMIGCQGEGSAYRLAEIVAATVLCGEISLGAAIASEEWVSSHDRYGRNRR